MRSTESRGLTPAPINADATASTWRRASAHVSICQASPCRWWIRGLSPYRAAWRKKTPTVVRSAIDSGLRSWVAVVAVSDVALLDRLDRECQRAGGNADRDLVALLASHERPAHRRLDRDASGRRGALDRADQVKGLDVALVVHHLDRRAGLSDARVGVLDDLRAPDHLLQLVDAAV